MSNGVRDVFCFPLAFAEMDVGRGLRLFFTVDDPTPLSSSLTEEVSSTSDWKGLLRPLVGGVSVTSLCIVGMIPTAHDQPTLLD